MRLHPALAMALLSLLAGPCLAGPCTQQIHAVQLRIDAALNQRAATGPAGMEGTAATLDRQPTPASMAAAETTLGDVSEATVQAVGNAMNRARKADRAGDAPRCRQALADAENTIKN